MQDIRQSILTRGGKDTNSKNRESADFQYAREKQGLETKQSRLAQYEHHRFQVYLGSKNDKAEIASQRQSDWNSYKTEKVTIKDSACRRDNLENKKISDYNTRMADEQNKRETQKRQWAQQLQKENHQLAEQKRLSNKQTYLEDRLIEKKNEKNTILNYQRTFL